MAKKELYRKIIATVLTVAVLGCALGICVWLLASSSLFSNTLRIIMLVCTLALATAIIGLIVCKVQEIRTLNDIVKLDETGAPAPNAQEDDDFLSQFVSPEEMNAAMPPQQAVQPGAVPPAAPDFSLFETADPFAQPSAPVQAQAPAAPAAAQPQTVQPGYAMPAQQPQQVQPQAVQPGYAMPAQPAVPTAAPVQMQPVETVQPEPMAAPAPSAIQTEIPAEPQEPTVQHNWKPINFHSFSEDNSLTQQQQAAQQAAMQAQQQYDQQMKEAQAMRQAQLAQEQAEAERQQRQAEEARRAALLEEAKRIQAQRRAQQLQMAQAARTGDVTNPVNTQQLDALARQQTQTQAQAVQTPQPIAQAVQNNILSQIEPEEPAAQPEQEEQPVIHKLNVKPIAWPAPPPPSKIFVTSQIPLITDEMIAAEKARQAAKNAAGQWENSTANLNQAQPLQ